MIIISTINHSLMYGLLRFFHDSSIMWDFQECQKEIKKHYAIRQFIQPT